jgi:hypothetical protein
METEETEDEQTSTKETLANRPKICFCDGTFFIAPRRKELHLDHAKDSSGRVYATM